MGQSASAKLAWGFDLGNEENDMTDENRATIALFNDLGWELRKSLNIEILSHGYEYTGHFLAYKPSTITAYWDNPKKIESLPTVTPEQREEFTALACQYGFPIQEPFWHLMAEYA